MTYRPWTAEELTAMEESTSESANREIRIERWKTHWRKYVRGQSNEMSV